MKTVMTFALALCGAAALATAVTAQNSPAINFDSAPNALTLPDDIYLGEVGGVATNSRGDIFVYTRTGHPTMSIASARPFVHGGSRLFQFDRNGKFTREIGQGVYGFLFAAQVRVDPQDNLWVVDEYASMVMKFDPQGRVVFLLGRKPESIQNPGRAGGAGGGGGGGRGGEGGRGAEARRGTEAGRGGGGAQARGRGRRAPGAGAPPGRLQSPTHRRVGGPGATFGRHGPGNAR